MTKTYAWGLPEHLPDGHRIFRGHFDRFAIADNSGKRPEQTDDGILWLDQTRPLRLETNVFEVKEYLHIPLVDEDGTATHTITNAQTLLYLSARFNWVIRTETGTEFTVTST
jgi:hypothetical protein